MTQSIDNRLLLTSSKFIRQKEYWTNKLSGFSPGSKLLVKTNGNRPAQSRIDKIDIPINGDLNRRLMKVSKQSDLSIYIILLSGLKLLVHRYTGSEDIAVVSPLYKSDISDETLNNSLLIRDSISGDMTFKELIVAVRKSVLEAYDNQDYPFDQLIEFLFNTRRIPFDKINGGIHCSLKNIHPQEEARGEEETGEEFFFSFQQEQGKISGFIFYHPGIYDSIYTGQLTKHYISLLEQGTGNFDVKISSIQFLSKEEKQRLLHEFNNTGVKYDHTVVVHRLFEKQAKRSRDRIALVYRNEQVTYGQLNARANRLARVLRRKGIRPDRTAALMMEPSVEMITGILAILKAGGSYLSIDPAYPQKRISTMLEDSSVPVLLTTESISRSFLAFARDKEGHLKNRTCRELIFLDQTDEVTGEEENSDLECINQPSDLAYIIYTSGSTGIPKGVMVEHRNMVAYLNAFYREFEITSRSVVAQQAAYTFDAFVEEVFSILLKGGKLAIPWEYEMIDIPLSVKFIARNNVNIVDCSPLMLNELDKRGGGRGVQVFISGGDVLKREYIDNLLKEGRVYNTYGPTETTVCATYYQCQQRHPSNWNIPIGKPITNYKIFILDKYDQLLPIGIPGQLSISGPGVTRGYLNRPELTAEKFDHDSWDDQDYQDEKQKVPGKRIYMSYIFRTGDLARWLPDGNIEFLGRMDRQVKIRGCRIELGEIEIQLLSHKDVKEAVVILRGNTSGERYLCAYLVRRNEAPIDKITDSSKLRNFLSSQLPDYMIPSYFVSLEKLPRASNGKIDRNALPEPVIKAGSDFVGPGTDVQEKLVNIWAEVLQLDREVISIDDNFFELGGHSLKAVILIAAIHRELDIIIPLAEFFENQTIRALSVYAEQAGKVEYASIKPVEKREYYTLSSAQKRLYFLQQLDLKSTNYNIPTVIPLGKDVEKTRLESVLEKLIARHESLRTSFIMVANDPAQRIRDEVEFEIDYLVAEGTEGTEERRQMAEDREQATGGKPGTHPSSIIRHQFIRPFDLSRAPLVRSTLVKYPDGSHNWIVDIHHIISDGTSQTILTEDFLALYNRAELEPLKLHYKDFSQWQHRLFRSTAVKVQKDYWLNLYRDIKEIPRLQLPTDFKRPGIFTFAGADYEMLLEKEDAVQFKSLSSRHGGTLYMNMLAALNTLFYKYTNQTDITIGTGIAGRRHPDLRFIIGMFVNTLAMRNYPRGEKTYESLLKEVIANSIKAFESQDIQFETLVERLDPERDPSRNPLFDISMVVQNIRRMRNPREKANGQGENSGQWEVLPPAHNNVPSIAYKTTAKFDMTFFIYELGDEVYIRIEYYTGVFKEETIHRLASHFKQVVKTVIRHPAVLLKDIDIIPGEEKKKILYFFNDTTRDYPREKTIPHLFAQQVQKKPDRIAVVYEEEALTYKELDVGANRLSDYLHYEKEIHPGSEEPVGILLSPSLYLPVSILGTLKAGGVYVPLDPQLPQERIKFMIEDARISTVISGKRHVNRLSRLQWECDCFHSYLGVASYDIHTRANRGSEKVLSSSKMTPAHLAYIIYTSGTTGRPKGVLLRHRGIANLHTVYVDELKIDHRDKIIQFANISFDASISEMFMALLNGAVLHLLHEKIINDYQRFHDYLNRHLITIATLPPIYANHLNIEDFNNLRLLITAGSSPDIDFVKRCLDGDSFEYINAYGPTEDTICSSYWKFNQDGDLDTVTIGGPLTNKQYYIVNEKSMMLQPIGVPGELCIAGVGLARGYLNQPELTAEKFERAVVSHSSSVISSSMQSCNHASMQYHSHSLYSPHSPYSTIYRTGDLARWLPNGTVEFLGRVDQQVKLRGFRIELEEIENQLLNHYDIKDAAVIERVNPTGDKYLCAYIVGMTTVTPRQTGKQGQQPEIDAGELREYLSRTLPGYMIPSYFIQMQKMPLVTSGKLDRKALPQPEPTIDGGDKYIAPRDPVEKKLVKIWAEVLNIDRGVIGIDGNFFRLGGHSLKATILISKIHKELNVNVPLTEVFNRQTVRGLSGYIRQAVKSRHVNIAPVEKKDYYTLSSAQRRLYIIRQMDTNNIGYNSSVVVLLEGKMNEMIFREIFLQLISRHESLRTSFHVKDYEPVQRIHDQVEFEMVYYQEEVKVKPQEIISNFIRPFDLSRAPLLRVGLVKTAAQQHLLMMDMHHIISDGTSIGILIKDFMKLNAKEELFPLKSRYKDYSEWQHSAEQKEVAQVQEKYWLKQFGTQGDIPVLNLPYDYQRPMIQGFEGNTIKFEIGKTGTTILNALALKEKTTLYMLLLSLYYVFLSKLSGQEDIVVGIPTAGRRHEDLREIIGIFVNTLALRNFPAVHQSFKEFLAELKQRTLDAYENQEYPFEELVEKVVVGRDIGRNPLFDTLFVFQNVDIPDVEIQGLKLKPYEYKNMTTVFDLLLEGTEVAGRLLFKFTFSTALFKKESIQRLIGYFKRIVTTISEDSQIKLSQIDILSEEERKQVLVDFNDTEAEYPHHKPIDEVFIQQVDKGPDHIALIAVPRGGKRPTLFMTYRAVEERSGKLAVILREKGVCSDTMVGLLLERSLEMTIGILAILKSGGAYLPIDPDYPAERIRYMLEDSCTDVLFTHSWLMDKAKQNLRHQNHFKLCRQLIPIDEPPPASSEARTREKTHHSRTLAYVMYTSGSTGHPKAVMVEHKSVNRLVLNTDYVELSANTRILQTGVPVFDASTFEMWGSLLNGGRLYLVGNDIILNVNLLRRLLVENRINTLWLSSPLFNQLVQQDNQLFSTLTYLLVGGDVLSPPHIKIARRSNKKLKIVNGYGPTENTTFSVCHLIDRDIDHSIPIGKPINNSFAYILDKNNRLQAIGIPGELCVGGDGLSRGYLNNPELTSKKFDHDLWDYQDYRDEEKKGTIKKYNKRFFTDISRSRGQFLQKAPLGHRKQTVYRTGDLARWLADGTIEFLGRMDHRVKIRGFRVELKEIESYLLKHPQINEVVVQAKKKENQLKYLCAYFVSNTTHSEQLTAASLRKYLGNYLPDYTIPSYFMQLDFIPLNPNGKLDKSELPEPEAKLESRYRAPASRIGQMVASAWKKILKLEKVGIYDNFFDIGGNSIVIMRLAAELKELLGIEVPITRLFQYPTIACFASYLDKSNKWNKEKKPAETGNWSVESKDSAKAVNMANRLKQQRSLKSLKRS